MNVQLNKSYNFRVLDTGVYGAAYRNMKLRGIVDSGTALLKQDIYTTHAHMKELVNGMPESADDLNWLIFKNYDDEDELIIAYEYLDESSIEEVTMLNMKIEITNATTSDLSIVRRTLSELGYTFNIVTY